MADNIGVKLALDGEREFKRALSDINRSFKVLGSEMKLVQSQFDKNDNSVEALTARNTVLNKEIDAQKQKVETLRTALENAASSFGENDKRTQNWQIQLNNAEAALNGMERELQQNNAALADAGNGMEDAGKAADDLGKKLKNAGNLSDDANGKFSRLITVAGAVGKAMAAAVAAIGAAAVAAGKELWDMANDVASAGDAIDKTSQKIGISAESYQEWGYVFERCGADVDNLQAGMKKLSGVITDAVSGSSSAAEKLNAVGLSIADLNGKSQDEQLSLVISALQDMESGAERTAAANDLLGRSATDMAAVLNMTAADTEALKQEAHDYGMVMSGEAVAASATFADSLTKLQRTLGGVKNRLTGDLLPGITQIMDGLSDLVAGVDGAGDGIRSGVTSVIDTITGMIPKASELIATLAATVLESAPAIIAALATGILAAVPQLTPVVQTIVSSLAQGLLALLPQIVSAGVEVIASLGGGIADALPNLVPQVTLIITQIVQTLLSNMPQMLSTALQLVSGLAQGVLDAIPELVAALPDVVSAMVEFFVGAVPQLINTGITLLTALIAAMPDILAAIVDAMPLIICAVTDTLLANLPLLIDTGVTLLTALIRNLPQVIAEIVRAMPRIITGMVNALLPGVQQMAQVGQNLVRGLWQGIQSLAGWLWSMVYSWISSIWDGIMGFFGIHSPSKKMGWIGEMLVEGLSRAIDGHGREAVDAAGRMSGEISRVMEGLAADMAIAAPGVNMEVQQAKSTGDLVNGIVGGLSAALGANNTQPIIVQVQLDKKTIAQGIFDPLRDVSKQRGVSLG